MKTVLLYSGGMDSWLIDQLEKPDIKLFIDIGTASSESEKKRLPSDVTIVPLRDLHLFERKETDFILPLRNLYFLALASNYGERLILGANATDICCDKTDLFAQKAEDILNYLWQPQKWTQGKHITVDFAYKRYTKSELLKKYVDQGGSYVTAFTHTFSCYTPIHGYECHNCRPCFLKLMAFIANGYDLPKEVLRTYVPYIEGKLKEYSDKWQDRLYSKEDYEKVLYLAR